MNRRVFYDVDAFADALEHLNPRYMLLGPQRAPWELCQLILGDVVVQWGAAGAAHVCEGRTSADVVSLVLPLWNTEGISANGVRMDDCSLLVLPPDGDFCFASDDICQWVALTFPEHLISVWRGIDPPVGRWANPVRRLTAGSAARFRSTLDRLFTAADEDPVSVASVDAISIPSEVGELIDALELVLTEPVDREAGSRGIPRARIVHSAVDHLRGHDREPVSVNELAAAAGVCERTLRTAFSEYYRTGPNHFLRLRRLHEAHRALRVADPQATTVTQVATSLGVWELGKFARDYRRLFGESPSVTLRASAP